MTLQILQLTGTGAANATTDGVAALDIPEDGLIMGVDWDIWAEAEAATAVLLKAQLSFLATNQFDTNDARGPISNIYMKRVITTSGASMASTSKWVSMPTPLQVAGGERIFVHTDSSAATWTVGFAALVHFQPGKTRVRRSQRRR